MSAELVSTFEALGVILQADGATLRAKAPVGVLTSELRAVLAGNKPALLAALVRRGEKAAAQAAESDARRPSEAVLGLAKADPWEDPRADLAKDSALWRRLLFAAYAGGHEPESLFWILQGFRCYGAGLRLGESTAILEHGEIDAAEYGQWRRQYLEQHAAELRALLVELGQG